MVTVKYYDSPLGLIFLAADDTGLIGLWFEGQKYFAQTLTRNYRTGSTPILESAVRWLRGYFSGEKPSFTPPLHLIGTDCQIAVWKRLLSIPYGTTATYADIGKRVAAQRTGFRPSPQAVGGIVSQNPISIIIPSHRVVPANGSLTGYAGGVIHRARLLMLEKTDMRSFLIPASVADLQPLGFV